jgi:hypothetical protein
MRITAFALLSALILSACVTAPLQTAPCPAERAIYALRGQDNARLRLFKPPHAQNASSDLAAIVDFEGERYWFAFTSSLGYSRNYIGRTGDMIEAARREHEGLENGENQPEPEFDNSEIVLFDAHYNVIESLPQSGDPAPAYLYSTGIGSAIWYSIPRRSLNRALWDLTGCAQSNTL